jgi:hypothetical protein
MFSHHFDDLRCGHDCGADATRCHAACFLGSRVGVLLGVLELFAYKGRV